MILKLISSQIIMRMLFQVIFNSDYHENVLFQAIFHPWMSLSICFQPRLSFSPCFQPRLWFSSWGKKQLQRLTTTGDIGKRQRWHFTIFFNIRRESRHLKKTMKTNSWPRLWSLWCPCSASGTSWPCWSTPPWGASAFLWWSLCPMPWRLWSCPPRWVCMGIWSDVNYDDNVVIMSNCPTRW